MTVTAEFAAAAEGTPVHAAWNSAKSTAQMQMVLDDIQVCISIARRQQHEALEESGMIAGLEIEIQSSQESKIDPGTTALQKPLLAESSESTRLKARISGLWNRDFPLDGFAENKIPLAEPAEDPKLIN